MYKFLIVFSIIHRICCEIPQQLDIVGTHLDCYTCYSTRIGCGRSLDFILMRLQPCYGRDAKCVKIYEVKGSETHYARGCLSELESVRMDMPTVRENGCWTKDNQYLGHGRRVFSNEQLTKQQNIYCFCNERDGCNSVRMNKVHILILFFPIILLYFSS